MEALANFLETMEPLFNLHLAANQEQRAFDNYEVLWDEEFGEINDLHLLQTDFDFLQANQAVQKTLNLEKDSQPSTKAFSDDWGESKPASQSQTTD